MKHTLQFQKLSKDGARVSLKNFLIQPVAFMLRNFIPLLVYQQTIIFFIFHNFK